MHLFNGKYVGPELGEFSDIEFQGSLGIGKKVSNVNTGGPSRFNRSYMLDFRLNYELPPGKRLCMFGKIPECSNWDKSKPHCYLKPSGEKN